MATQEQKSRVALFEAELGKLEKKYDLKISPYIDFPQYKELPIEVQLAMAVIKSHGARFIAKYVDLRKDKKNE